MAIFAAMAKVLFIGHALISGDLPRYVESGLRALEAPAEVQGQSILGAPLIWNWDHAAEEKTDGRVELAKGDVSDLVLVEAMPISDHQQWSDTAGMVRRWTDAAVSANPEAQVWLVQTWPAIDSSSLTGEGEYWRDAIAAELPLWIDLAGSGPGAARIVPVGQALSRLSLEVDAGNIPGLTTLADLFSPDSAPNGRAEYFIAMVHLAALTGTSPEGLPLNLGNVRRPRSNPLTEAQAQAFQRIAWETVQGFSPETVSQGQPPAAAITGEMPAFGAVTNRNLTLGLSGVNDWSVQLPFLDLMKTARPWIGHLPNQWGGWGEAELAREGALDPNGWPTRIPAPLTTISTLILTDLPGDTGGVAGSYNIFWEGEGRLDVGGRGEEVLRAPGLMVFDYTPGPGAVEIVISKINPVNPLRNIQVVREDRLQIFTQGEIFNPDWLARIEGVRGLRFMDWLATNDSPLMAVADRPRLADYSWARRGVPVEIAVALANRLRAEPWINIPHAAEDALVREMAEVVQRDLDPGLRAWVEYSNEVWNGQFEQARWADEQAQARWGQRDSHVQFYALRATEVMAIWSEVFGNPDRLVRVVATQTGWIGLEENILAAPLVLAEGRPLPAESFDAYAITGYFSGFFGAEHKIPLVKGWIAESTAAAEAEAMRQGLDAGATAVWMGLHRYDLAVERAEQELRDGRLSGKPEDTISTVRAEILPYHAAIAKKYGLSFAMYEGGSHVVGYGPAVEDAALTEFFVALNYSPGMGRLYGEFLAAWAEVSDQPFNGFVDVSTPSKWGSWGALRHLWDDNPRWRALARGCDPC